MAFIGTDLRILSLIFIIYNCFTSVKIKVLWYISVVDGGSECAGPSTPSSSSPSKRCASRSGESIVTSAKLRRHEQRMQNVLVEGKSCLVQILNIKWIKFYFRIL